MRTRLLVVVFASASVLLAPSAHAGGWWSYIDLEGRYLGIGETVIVRSEVMFRTLKAAEAARTTGAYHAYLVRGVDTRRLSRAMSQPEPKRWWTPPKEMTLVGDVKLSHWDANLAMSTTHLRIPELAPGKYDLMLCNEGCTSPLGDLIPLRVQVLEDPLTARTARRLQQTNDRLDLGLASLRDELQDATRDAGIAVIAANDAKASTRLLREKLSETLARQPTTPWGSYAGWFLAGVIVGALALVRLLRRVPQGFRPKAPLEQAPVDSIKESTGDPQRELVSR